jgi:tripartite-type tricarboxylate transporter receptor subunit TctC
MQGEGGSVAQGLGQRVGSFLGGIPGALAARLGDVIGRQAVAGTLGALVAVLLAGVPGGEAQQVYPTRPITVVVPAAAGGPTDTVARLIAEPMGRALGQQIVVENVGGAGGTIGVGRVAKAGNDGYTLLVWHIGQSTAPSLYDNLRYDVFNDFDPIGRITDVPMTIVGKTSLPPKDVAELITWLRERQDQVTYAHAGIGSAAHLCGLMLMSALNIKMNAVVYRGTGPAMNDLVGGQFDVMCDQTTGTANQIKAGTIKGFAATTKTRIPLLAELPTLDEAGVKGFEVAAWHALWGPKGLPKEVVEKLTAALQGALREPVVIERMAGLATVPVAQDLATPAALQAQLEAEVAKWGAVIRAAGVKAN